MINSENVIWFYDPIVTKNRVLWLVINTVVAIMWLAGVRMNGNHLYSVL